MVTPTWLGLVQGLFIWARAHINRPLKCEFEFQRSRGNPVEHWFLYNWIAHPTAKMKPQKITLHHEFGVPRWPPQVFRVIETMATSVATFLTKPAKHTGHGVPSMTSFSTRKLVRVYGRQGKIVRRTHEKINLSRNLSRKNCSSVRGLIIRTVINFHKYYYRYFAHQTWTSGLLTKRELLASQVAFPQSSLCMFSSGTTHFPVWLCLIKRLFESVNNEDRVLRVTAQNS